MKREVQKKLRLLIRERAARHAELLKLDSYVDGRKIGGLKVRLRNLDAKIKAIVPDFDPSTIRPKRQLAKRFDLPKRAFSDELAFFMMDHAGVPLSLAELRAAMRQQLNLPTDTVQQRANLTGAIETLLWRWRKRGVVKQALIEVDGRPTVVWTWVGLSSS